MDLTTNWESPKLDVKVVKATQHCDICTKRGSDPMLVLSERHGCLESPGGCQTWHLCEQCAAAVLTEVERTALRTPLRVRIAVGMVAAARRPAHRPVIVDADFWKWMREDMWDWLTIGFVLCVLALPPIVIMLVAVLLLPSHPGH